MPGAAVHDGWSPYWRYPVTHALCGAHLLRELEAITDEPGQGWAAGMAELLADAKTQADRAPDPRGRWAGQACLGPPRQGRAGRLYDALRRFPPVIAGPTWPMPRSWTPRRCPGDQRSPRRAAVPPRTAVAKGPQGHPMAGP